MPLDIHARPRNHCQKHRVQLVLRQRVRNDGARDNYTLQLARSSLNLGQYRIQRCQKALQHILMRGRHLGLCQNLRHIPSGLIIEQHRIRKGTAHIYT